MLRNFGAGMFILLLIAIIVLVIILVIRITQKEKVKQLGIAIGICGCFAVLMLVIVAIPTTVYKVGQDAKSGDWNIKVTSSKEGTKIRGNAISNPINTTQKFIMVQLEMTNIDSKQQQYSEDDFTLFNAKDKKEYSISNDATEAIETINANNNLLNMNDYTNPNIPKEVALVFEVPKNVDISNSVLEHKASGVNVTKYYIK